MAILNRRRPAQPPFEDAAALSAVLQGSTRPAPRLAEDHGPLTVVPLGERLIVAAFLRSRMPQDEARGRELATAYGLDFDGIRRQWGVEPVSQVVEVEGVEVRL